VTTGPSGSWAAVVVNYEAGPLLLDCVQSLLADTSAGAAPDVVVVDNGSRDGSVATLRAAVPSVHIVDAGTNLGYAAAANRGIAATEAAVVAVCNPDAKVEPGTARALIDRLETEPDLGAVGPAVFEPDGSRYPSARQVPSTGDAVAHALLGKAWPRNPFTRRYRELDADPDQPREVDWVSGAAVWLRRSALDTIDGWDERYFMYVEDVDLCWRLRQAGWRIGYEPGGTVVHIKGASTDRHPYRMIATHHRSLLRFAARRWRGWRRVLLVPAALFLGLRAAVSALARAVNPRARSRG
jgi:N-acetylglucosaminyl-diphospho-decaprenol L-rhamnosyltransferase